MDDLKRYYGQKPSDSWIASQDRPVNVGLRSNEDASVGEGVVESPNSDSEEGAPLEQTLDEEVEGPISIRDEGEPLFGEVGATVSGSEEGDEPVPHPRDDSLILTGSEIDTPKERPRLGTRQRRPPNRFGWED